ncbi:uncharacterized protein LACBIDRAFT_335211 [Laccaria bicolor S238N-H82]|uniref:Predicted protein n=1 Tax=Laccaria bicolor (strain S238N-H82 / ATCC MYA-4686) TaxID=486041 RepID=B0E1P8_LACBS|nr:uncharacterized protein LACBIDRAFT_335211 [Laccaria bicolor S238N-H82]EDQ99211.1 predicted protein [Laccaria bicolor S238N-H82]|eukprot:XP_001890108.1 predicted protein [Laccaria bicolor S238N-H82]
MREHWEFHIRASPKLLFLGGRQTGAGAGGYPHRYRFRSMRRPTRIIAKSRVSSLCDDILFSIRFVITVNTCIRFNIKSFKICDRISVLFLILKICLLEIFQISQKANIARILGNIPSTEARCLLGLPLRLRAWMQFQLPQAVSGQLFYVCQFVCTGLANHTGRIFGRLGKDFWDNESLEKEGFAPIKLHTAGWIIGAYCGHNFLAMAARRKRPAEDLGQLAETISREKKFKVNEKKELLQFATKTDAEQTLVLYAGFIELKNVTIIDSSAVENMLDPTVGGYCKILFALIELLDSIYEPAKKKKDSSESFDGANRERKRLQTPKNIFETAKAVVTLHASTKISVTLELCVRLAFLGPDYWGRVDKELEIARTAHATRSELSGFFAAVLEDDMEEFGQVEIPE